MTGTPPPTPPPVAWDEEQSRRWLAHLELREAPLLPVPEALLERSRLSPGERVLAAVRSDLVTAFDGWRDATGIGLPGGVLHVSARPGRQPAHPVGAPT